MFLVKFGIIISISIQFCFAQSPFNVVKTNITKDTIYIDEDNYIVNAEIFKIKFYPIIITPIFMNLMNISMEITVVTFYWQIKPQSKNTTFSGIKDL